jgi:hypothetical protein
MTPLESLTAKIHALLPELLELSFGCKYSWTQEVGLERIYTLGCEEVSNNMVCLRNGQIVKINKILGHPITLEHIMKAVDCTRISRGRKLLPISIWLYVNQTGRIWTDKHSREAYVWTLGLPLDQQSPETIKFLDDLLPSPNEE